MASAPIAWLNDPEIFNASALDPVATFSDPFTLLNKALKPTPVLFSAMFTANAPEPKPALKLPPMPAALLVYEVFWPIALCSQIIPQMQSDCRKENFKRLEKGRNSISFI
jgi:hypothetical protein